MSVSPAFHVIQIRVKSNGIDRLAIEQMKSGDSLCFLVHEVFIELKMLYQILMMFSSLVDMD